MRQISLLKKNTARTAKKENEKWAFISERLQEDEAETWLFLTQEAWHLPLDTTPEGFEVSWPTQEQKLKHNFHYVIYHWKFHGVLFHFFYKTEEGLAVEPDSALITFQWNLTHELQGLAFHYHLEDFWKVTQRLGHIRRITADPDLAAMVFNQDYYFMMQLAVLYCAREQPKDKTLARWFRALQNNTSLTSSSFEIWVPEAKNTPNTVIPTLWIFYNIHKTEWCLLINARHR